MASVYQGDGVYASGPKPPGDPADRIEYDANERAFELEREQLHYNRWLQEATARARRPYMDQAMAAAGGFSNWTPPTWTEASPFQAPDRATALADPAYQFAVGEGQRGIERMASARGNVLTGGTLKDLQQFGQEAASQQYDKVYGRAHDAYTLAETLRGQVFDRNANAGYQSAALQNQNTMAMMQQYLGLAELAAPGEYPGYPGALPRPDRGAAPAPPPGNPGVPIDGPPPPPNPIEGGGRDIEFQPPRLAPYDGAKYIPGLTPGSLEPTFPQTPSFTGGASYGAAPSTYQPPRPARPRVPTPQPMAARSRTFGGY